MPRKGYKQSSAHRRKIREKNQLRAQIVRDALARYKVPATMHIKGTKPHHTDPTPTPIPPSASGITVPAFQRWGVYSYHEAGKYYYKREQADDLSSLRKLVTKLELELPLWTYVISGHTEKEVYVPIRIDGKAIPSLGHRWQKFKHDRRGWHMKQRKKEKES